MILKKDKLVPSREILSCLNASTDTCIVVFMEQVFMSHNPRKALIVGLLTLIFVKTDSFHFSWLQVMMSCYS